MQKTWRLLPANPDGQKLLASSLGISPVIAQILINRGIDSVETARFFLSPSLKNLPQPFFLPNMERGVERILKAIREKETIAIYGDYDVDGLSSAALLSLFFREIGVATLVHIPDRLKEGYGLQGKALDSLKERGAKLVITADCGTKSHAALQHAKTIGLDVIVTDHHALDQESSPAFAFINPQLLPNGSLGQELAGVGVAFFLLMALRQKMREQKLFENGEPNLKQHLDLVALGTIGDMAPLIGINRILVSFGLKELAQTKKPGLIALKEIAKLEKETTLDCSDIGFRLAPRINAGGRIAQAQLGLNLLCSDDLERGRGLAKILDQCNSDRQGMQEKQVRQAIEMASQKETQFGLVVACKDWHPGIVGLVASKLTDHFYCPSIALSIEGDFARGSGRSIAGIHIVEILEECADLLEQFGGHAAAAGLTLRAENLEKFEERFKTVLRKKTAEEAYTRSIKVDCELKLADIDDRLLKELESLKPFGIKNPEPVFLGKSLHLKESKIVAEKHLKFKVADDLNQLDAIAFNMGDLHPFKQERGDLVFAAQWNIWRDVRIIQLKIKDLKH
ncbi:MAG: single-stranded-DNA-specific exonuclease RecJ [Deltaproteobacteria bacterium]|nr:single-stranded-DNA-specific exonuclease RecJ [Deltaproteobacteria bacterium]